MSGKKSKPNKKKDLGVFTSEDVSFAEYIENFVQSTKIMSGFFIRNFESNVVNAYTSKIEYGSLVWNSLKKEEKDKLERIQKNFTSRIKSLENLNCQ